MSISPHSIPFHAEMPGPLGVPHLKTDVDSTDKMMLVTNLPRWPPTASGVRNPVGSASPLPETRGGFCETPSQQMDDMQKGLCMEGPCVCI